MKKHLILFFLISTLTLTSCSKDDEAVNNNNDRILGTWVLVEISPNPYFNIDCSQESTISLHEDHTASSTYYFSEENCEPKNTEGIWGMNAENSKYELTVPVLGSVEGTVTFEGSDSFIFNVQGFQLIFERQ